MSYAIEPERYELFTARPSRRGFFKLLGGGIVVVSLWGQESGGGRRRGGRGQPQEIGAWLHIGEDGAITAYTGKVEVGQNARTSLTMAVAEELGAPLASIRLVMGDTQLTPFDMGTFGSMTTPAMFSQLRRVGAAARQALEELAAAQGKKPPLDFAELARGQALLKKVIASPKLKAPADWKLAGTSVAKVNAREMITGRHRYTSDLKRPQMLHGRVARPPSFGAELISVEKPALKDATFVRDGNLLGVAAPTEHAAARAAAAIKAEWRETPQISNKELHKHLKETASGSGQPQVRGSIEEGMSQAERKLQATYTVAYIAHAPLEPRAAVAEWDGDRLTVWTGTQRPFGVQGELVEALGIPESNVRVIVPDTGSGYGGKHTGEAATEAARLAKAAGRPVKLVWTREEEFTWAYARPAGVIEVTAGLRADGHITAWEFHNYNSGASAIRTLYDIPHQRIAFHPSRSPLRQGSYRGLAATANHFARESAMDELAALAGLDPLEFRLKNLKDPRLRAVLEAAAERFGWGKVKNAGIAGGFEKGSYIATCAEVRMDGGQGPVRVERVVQAFDCGAIVNPDQLKNQVEGGIIQGLGGALFEALEFENGRLLNARFSKYRVPRFHDVPKIDVVLVDRKDLPPAGAGETPIVGIAPAVGNAIFAESGTRLRALPLLPGKTSTG